MEGGEVRGQHSGVARVSIACSVVAAATGEKSRCTWVIPVGRVLQVQVLALRLTVALSPSLSPLPYPSSRAGATLTALPSLALPLAPTLAPTLLLLPLRAAALRRTDRS